MAMTCSPVEVETGSTDREGMLVFDGTRLLAVLVRLSALHEDYAGAWCLEYGPALEQQDEPFNSLERALIWIERTIKP